MKQFLCIVSAFLLFAGCGNKETAARKDLIIAPGQMPNVAKESSDKLHLAYGYGDSIMYSFSSNGGQTFSAPALVSVLPKLAASHTRGPQVAVTSSGFLLTACNTMGDIFSFVKDAQGGWQQTGKVNDADTVAKENLMALGADGDNAFAVWLDLRDGHNKIFGAKSIDGGKTWLKNLLVYASPDTTVCECCKPSVVVKGNDVFVMFRNWLNGNRDLHIIQSSDGGQSFAQAKKLGTGSWALKGCPMDGGGLVVDKAGRPQTVWNREGKIYTAEPGKAEKEIGEGRSCTMESVNGKSVYAWVENSDVVVLKPNGTKQNLGKGQLPVIKAINNEQLLCVWERDKQIHTAVVAL